jgi:glycosyltransferase involved in cell wall biosynthesis
MTQKKVSMIMPCHNSAPYLEGMLGSVIRQSYGNVELVAVDDGSTDGTLEALRGWRESFARRGYGMRIVVRKKNGGLCAAINSGLAAFTGEYVCFPDSDDWLYPDYLSELAACLERNPGCGWAKCDAERVKEESPDKRWGALRQPGEDAGVDAFRHMLSGRAEVGVWAILARRDYLAKHMPGLRIYEDAPSQEWQIQLPLSFGGPFKATRSTLYRYIRRGGSLSQTELNKPVGALIDYWAAHERGYRASLAPLPLSPVQRAMADRAATLVFLRTKYDAVAKHGAWDRLDALAKQLLDLAEAALPGLSPPAGEARAYFIPLLEACMDRVLGFPPRLCEARASREKISAAMKQAGRYLVYGAGEAAARIVPALIREFGPPLAVWDRAAGREGFMGAPLAKPGFDSVAKAGRAALPVIVAIRDEFMAGEAAETLRAHGYENLFSFDEALDALRARFEGASK